MLVTFSLATRSRAKLHGFYQAIYGVLGKEYVDDFHSSSFSRYRTTSANNFQVILSLAKRAAAHGAADTRSLAVAGDASLVADGEDDADGHGSLPVLGEDGDHLALGEVQVFIPDAELAAVVGGQGGDGKDLEGDKESKTHGDGRMQGGNGGRYE